MRMSGRWIVLGFGLQAFGCGSEVVIVGGGQQPGPCQPAQQQAQLRVSTRGTFIDGRLHVDATVDGERRYVVLEVGDEEVFILDAQEALVGPAQLVLIANDTYARLHAPQQQVQIDLIDTRDPLAPQLAASHALDGVGHELAEGAGFGQEGLARNGHLQVVISSHLVQPGARRRRRRVGCLLPGRRSHSSAKRLSNARRAPPASA